MNKQGYMYFCFTACFFPNFTKIKYFTPRPSHGWNRTARCNSVHVRRFALVFFKEVIKEQPTSQNLSATATRVLQCTCPVAASRKDFSAIHTSTSPHLNSSHTCFINNIILLLLLVLCTAVNVLVKN